MRPVLLCFIAGVTCAAFAACSSSSGGSSSGPSASGDGGGSDAPAVEAAAAVDASAFDAGDADVAVGPGGGDASRGDGGDGSAGPCTMTFTGAVNKTLACTLSATYVTQNNRSAFSVTSPGAPPEATFVLTIDGELSATTYTWANSAEQTGSLTESSTAAWDLSLQGTRGSSSVTFSRVSTMFNIASGKIYTVGGTVTATLDPLDQGSTVQMTVAF